MRVDELLKGTGIPVPPALAGMEVVSLQEDSRKVCQGSVFIAMGGFSSDGHDFIRSALEKGAVAVVAERRVGDDPRVLLNPSGNNRKLLSQISARFYDYPWRDLSTFGITGTNGKTSTARMLAWILEKTGKQTGIMGTVGHLVGGRTIGATMTTPGSLEMTRIMDSMRRSGDRCCVMEVSSHALSLERVESVRFDAAVFTNITQDHLDYHGSMEDYLACKVHLFDLMKDGGCAVVGTYSPGYPRIPGARTFGIRDDDDYRISDVDASLTGIRFRVDHEDDSAIVAMKTPGGFNVYNATGALAAAVERGTALEAAAEALRDFPGVPGRFQAVDNGQDFLVAVDYAHTPDALKRVLEQAGELTENRVIVVFGAGGDRDSAKRPIMGGIASELADTAIVTSDNPRTEDPARIIEDILRGITKDSSKKVIVQPDRRAAIFEAVRLAEPGDVLIIAGKGHEDYQILGREKIHFDDREVAFQALVEVQR